MTSMLPNRHVRSAADIRNHIRGTLPPMAGLDWMPLTGIDSIDELRTRHRRAALKLADAIDDLPARLAAVDAQIVEHGRALVAYDRRCRLAVQRGELIPLKVTAPNFPAALDTAWAPVQRWLADIEQAVRSIIAAVERNYPEMERRHVTPAELRGEWSFGGAGGNATPRHLAEGTRDGSLQLEISYFDRLLAQWREALDPHLATHALAA